MGGRSRTRQRRRIFASDWCRSAKRSPGPLGVGGATKKCVRKPCNIDEQRPRPPLIDDVPHATTGRGVERVSAKILNRRETQGVDRRLGDDQSRPRRFLQRQSEERLGPPVSEPLYVGPRTSTCATAPARSKWANQALPRGPSRRTRSATDAASMIVGDSLLYRLGPALRRVFDKPSFAQPSERRPLCSAPLGPLPYRPTENMATVRLTLAGEANISVAQPPGSSMRRRREPSPVASLPDPAPATPQHG